MIYREYIKFGLSAFAAMFLGSHVVYSYYQPMADFDQYVRKAELKRKQVLEKQISNNAKE